jgi:REP element-mobilizing transposase RayT
MPEYQRRLPHFQPDGACLFLTWRLWVSLPRQANSVTYSTPGQAFVAQDRALHQQQEERQFYHLCAWAVMPNHVHLLILPKGKGAVLMRWLKGSTARHANQILGRTGQPFWQDESYDHSLRHPRQIGRTTAYIEQNPVCAGLVRSAEDWPWSSAGWIG